MQVYYNTIIDSVETTAGSAYGTLPDNQKSYYTMNFAVQPNKLLFDMDNITRVETEEKPKVESSVEEHIADEEKETKIPLKTVTISNEYVPETRFTLSSNPEDSADVVIKLEGAKDEKMLLAAMDKYLVPTIQEVPFEALEDGQIVTFDDNGDMVPVIKYINAVYDRASYNENLENGKVVSYTPAISLISTGDIPTETQTNCKLY